MARLQGKTTQAVNVGTAKSGGIRKVSRPTGYGGRTATSGRAGLSDSALGANNRGSGGKSAPGTGLGGSRGGGGGGGSSGGGIGAPGSGSPIEESTTLPGGAAIPKPSGTPIRAPKPGSMFSAPNDVIGPYLDTGGVKRTIAGIGTSAGTVPVATSSRTSYVSDPKETTPARTTATTTTSKVAPTSGPKVGSGARGATGGTTAKATTYGTKKKGGAPRKPPAKKTYGTKKKGGAPRKAPVKQTVAVRTGGLRAL